MPAKPKLLDPGVGVRRSTRERKKVNFGSDFELDEPEKPPSKKARTEPEPDPTPTPGTSTGGGGGGVPPLPSLDDPDPAPEQPKMVTWPSEAEYWKKPTLPTNHSKRS